MQARRHKGQRPGEVAGILGVGTMTAWPAATGMSLGEGTGQEVVGDGKAAQEVELALAEARGLGAFGFAVHLVAIMLQTKRKSKTLFGVRK